MKLKHWLALVLLLCCSGLHAQMCNHTSLSKKFDFKITAVVMQKTTIGNVGSEIILKIINKANKAVVQTISIQTDFLFETAFQDCNQVRSYITGKNKDAETLDDDFGDLIIADFNFDGKEDIAIKRDSGGASGPAYEFYIQGENNTFIKNEFLTEKMSSFPNYINPKDKTLITDNASGVYWHTQRIFGYSAATKKWKLIKKTMIKQ